MFLTELDKSCQKQGLKDKKEKYSLHQNIYPFLMSNKKFYAMIFELLVNSSIFLYVEITGMRGTT